MIGAPTMLAILLGVALAVRAVVEVPELTYVLLGLGMLAVIAWAALPKQ